MRLILCTESHSKYYLKIGSVRKENTVFPHYKDHLVKPVSKNVCFLRESY